MSAQIYIHPRHPERLLVLCMQFNALGYMLRNTPRGHVIAQPIPVLTNVVALPSQRKP